MCPVSPPLSPLINLVRQVYDVMTLHCNFSHPLKEPSMKWNGCIETSDIMPHILFYYVLQGARRSHCWAVAFSSSCVALVPFKFREKGKFLHRSAYAV